MEYRQDSLKRAADLKVRIKEYLDERKSLTSGIDLSERIKEQKNKIMKSLNASDEQWDDYHWQVRSRITDVDQLKGIINLTNKEIEDIKTIEKRFRWAVSPYYLSLISPDEKFDPIKLLSIPSGAECVLEGAVDPMNELGTNPAGSITRRYPDRLIINVTNVCAMYCRHCQRRRNIGEIDNHNNDELIDQSIEYISANPEIRDVLLTGGDPLLISDNKLESILKRLRAIEHVEIIRIGSRTPVTMPQRITNELTDMLKKYHPIYLNTHFNHPHEITNESKIACELLSNNGVILGNQAVLLNGINNDKHLMKFMNQELLKIRVRPYYIFQAKHVQGTEHFVTSIDDGLEIMEHLRGFTSGLAIPYYIVNAPGGFGKTPIMPQYLISRGKETVKIRTWEGKVFDIDNKPTPNIKEILDV
jgi:lysine 2,3-aminomutase